MTDRADGFLPREEIPDRRSSSTLVALGKNPRMMRPARVSCGPSAANGLPLMPSASARTDCASSWHGSHRSGIRRVVRLGRSDSVG